MTKNKNTPKLRFPEFSEEWKNGIIGDISDNIMAGATPSTSVQEFWKNGSIPWLSSGEVNKRIIFETNNFITKKGFDSSSTKMVPKNSVLIGLAGQGKTRGTVAINKIELCTNQSIASIIVNNKAHYKFIFYALFKKYGELRVLSSSGSGRGGLNLKLVKSFKIKFSSFEEQEKIAIFLSKVDEKISLLEDKLNYFEDFKKFCMQQLFARKLRFKNAKCGSFPDWKRIPLGKIANINKGFTPSTNDSSNWNGNIPWLSIADMKNGKYLINTTKQITKKGSKNKKLVKKGSLIMSFKLTIGRLAILNRDMYTNEAICNFQWKLPAVSTEYMYYYLNSINIKKYGSQAAKGITLNNDSLETIPINLPILDEQKKIAFFLNNLENKEEKIATELENLKEFKKGLLQQMLI